MWDFAGGWGLSDSESRSGKYSASVIKNSPQYLNNMNTTMTYKSVFDFQPENVFIHYWRKYETEMNKDICYLELSGDKINWIKIDSLSGGNFDRWEKQKLVNISTIGSDKFWLRFHFISDSQNTMRGVFIDDIVIKPDPAVNIGPEELMKRIPKTYNLSQNYPNPFNPTTTINYELPITNYVDLSIYNLLGQKVVTLINERQKPGSYQVEWDANGFPSGIYYYRLTSGEFVDTKKLVLLR